MDKKVLWIISELFYPEETATAYILTAIANRLADKYVIHVLAGHEVYSVNNARGVGLADGIDVRRIAGKRIDKNNIVKRVWRAIYLSRKFARILDREARKGDTVIAVTNPVLNIVTVSKTCRRLGLKFIIFAHDVFPENAVPAGLISGKNPLYLALVSVFNRAYKRADMVVACGSDMKKVLEKKTGSSCHPVIYSIPNWSNQDIIHPSANVNTGAIKIKFAGNLGRVQGLDAILAIVKRLSNDDIQFIFQGDGAFSDLIKKAESPNLLTKGPYKRDNEQDVLSECDIGLVSLSPGMYGLGVPSKSYNLMAAGKPILFIGPAHTEIYEMIKENDIGWAFDIHEEEEIVRFLESIRISDRGSIAEKGMRARKLAESTYSKESILNQYHEII